MANKPYMVLQTKEQFEEIAESFRRLGYELGLEDGQALLLSRIFELTSQYESTEEGVNITYKARAEMRERRIRESQKSLQKMKESKCLRKNSPMILACRTDCSGGG